jgi:hypothetical protein
MNRHRTDTSQVNYPGGSAKKSTVDMVNAFLDWAQLQQNGGIFILPSWPSEKSFTSAVWIVSNEQLLDWVRHPVPVSQLDQIASLKCVTPQVDPSAKICNGIPRNEAGLTVRCPFNDSPFNTCVCTFLFGQNPNKNWISHDCVISITVRMPNQLSLTNGSQSPSRQLYGTSSPF